MTKTWQERFDEEFEDFYDLGSTTMDMDGHITERGSEERHYKRLKDFISSLLEEQKAQHVEILESMMEDEEYWQPIAQAIKDSTL